jgi:SnoaL-like domain
MSEGVTMATDPRPIAESGSTESPGARTAVDVVNQYLTSFYSGDFETAKSVVADDFSFRGPFLQVDGKEQFFAGAEGLRQIVRGHRLLRQWVDGDDVSTTYEVDFVTPAGEGSVLMSEWHILRHTQLGSGRVTFDSAAFRALVPHS